MAVPFEEAKATLISMFPTMDEETVSEVLKSNNGHMESTVEMLLEFSSLEGAEGSRVPGVSAGPAAGASAQDGSGDEALARKLEEVPYPSIDEDEALARRLQAMGGLSEDELLARQLSQMTNEEDEELARRLQEAFVHGRGEPQAQAQARAAWNESDYRADYNGSWEPVAPDSQRDVRGRDLAARQFHPTFLNPNTTIQTPRETFEGGDLAQSVTPSSSIFSVSYEDMKKKLGSMSDAAKRQMQDFVDAFYEDRDEDVRGGDLRQGDYQRVTPGENHRFSLQDEVEDRRDQPQVLVADREEQQLSRRGVNHHESDEDLPVTGYPADRKYIKMKPMRSTPLKHGDAKDE
eukprot:CAMPEP_0184326738 /NCGR_PEP_ID=MMETSP1049-20130417/142722_1 /TAXON_ID=77928 /ORGANISM="Proteomonas sulcata, Strain CCMP704" /LENGTH=347 /DNA_ID=CAMNT_0026648949 /DNA_START=27 /DNA_END=1069 /DNA_ORIENTATION=-